MKPLRYWDLGLGGFGETEGSSDDRSKVRAAHRKASIDNAPEVSSARVVAWTMDVPDEAETRGPMRGRVINTTRLQAFALRLCSDSHRKSHLLELAHVGREPR